jgi:polyisoprenoid-binding protein YceI
MTTNAYDVSRWRLDPARSELRFAINTLWGAAPVRGRFTDFHGELDLARNPAVGLTIDPASLDTGNARRDAHLRSNTFFAVEEHPRLWYASDSARLEGVRLSADGEIHCRGTRTPWSVEAALEPVGDEFEVKAVARLDHRALGMRLAKVWTALGLVARTGELVLQGRLVPDAGGF